MRRSGVVTLILCLWTTAIKAYYGIDYTAKAAYFNFQPGGDSQYVFALNVVANGDVYFHMSGPVVHSWLGVGFGNQMANSFMIIAYPSSNGLDTTISPRIATGHNEPTYAPDYEIVKVYNDTYAPNANSVTQQGTGTIIAHAMCRNCSQWATGFLDTKSKSQPLLFALGPQKTFREDSPEAGLPRHAVYGRYTVDMTKATNYTGWYGRVPGPNVPEFPFPPDDTAFASFATTPVVEADTMDDPMPTVHAALMCIAFVFIFPAGAIVMQFLKRALWHAAVQVVGFVMVFGGFGVAVKVAGQYNRSKDYNSAHQIIGLIILAGLMLQLGLGLVHHSMYVRTNKPTPFGRVHFFLGPFIMLLGLINAGVGFHFAGNPHLNLPYGIVVAAMGAVFIATISFQVFCRSRRKYKPQPESLEYPAFAQQGYSDYEMSRQPTFGEEPPQPYEPTTPYSPVGGQFVLTSPYSPTSPFTPLSAYTPVTPRTWKKQEITNWPLAPYKEYES